MYILLGPKQTLENATWLQSNGGNHRIYQFSSLLYGFLQYVLVPSQHPTAVVLDKMQTVFRIYIYCKYPGRTDLFPPSIPLPEFPYHLSTTHICQVSDTFSFVIFPYAWRFPCLFLRAALFLLHHSQSDTEDRPHLKGSAFLGTDLTFFIQ